MPKKIPGFSISTQVALIVGGIVLCSACFIGYYSIKTANEVLRREAIASIGASADLRMQLLVTKLSATRTRTRSILQMSEGICSAGSGKMRSCLAAVFGHFLRTTEAAGVQFYPLKGEPITVGLEPSMFSDMKSPEKNQIARIGRGRDKAAYLLVRAETDQGEIRAEFPIRQIESIFSSREGLGKTGEAFLTDASGYFLTSTAYKGPIGHSEPIQAIPIVRCLKGNSGESLGPDFLNVEKVHAFRPVNEVGGGCVMANIGATEAFAKSAALIRDLFQISLATLFAAVLSALWAARRLTVPIHLLVQQAQALERGDYDSRAEIRGPREIQTFASAFSKMTKSLLGEIAERKLAETELSRAIRSRDEFLATLSHELRTPMNIILGWIEILKTEGFDPVIFNQATNTLARNALLQKSLIDDLLDVSRIINGKFELDFENVDLGTVVRNICESLKPSALQKGIAVKLEIPAQPVRLLGDSTKLSQVTSNILQNAIKFTNAGGEIAVSLLSSGATVRLEIRDSGVGIDAAFLPHVFERLQQEDMATTRSHSGLGLGLAICRHIVEQHRGLISATSDGRGKGSTFIVELPLETMDARSGPGDAIIRTKDTSAPAARPNGRHVLIVDDSPDILFLLRSWLESPATS